MIDNRELVINEGGRLVTIAAIHVAIVMLAGVGLWALIRGLR